MGGGADRGAGDGVEGTALWSSLSDCPCPRNPESLTTMISLVFKASQGRPKAEQKALECACVDS